MSVRWALAAAFLLGCGSTKTDPKTPPGGDSGGFLKASGAAIVNGEGRSVLLRGVAFGNDVWSGRALPPTTHHSEVDYERIASWGMNAVRFYVNYQLFEDDAAPYQYKQSGWDWLDQNIAWAKQHGVYLILNVHVPQGGFQSNGEGNALWQVAENQARFRALWTAIAERYREEPTIAGYDLLNEPRPTTSREEWKALATSLLEGVRSVDTNHLVFVERTNSVGEDYANDADQNFFLLPDSNVVYEFHFYEPFEYTHQYASWLNRGEGGKYPDPSLISTAGLTWYDWNYLPEPPPYAPPGDSDWQYYESKPYAITDPDIKAIGVALVSELNAGSITFDDIVVKEVDADGNVVRTVYEDGLESLDGWYYWKETGSTGEGTLTSDAHSGSGALVISGTNHDSNFSGSFRFAPVAGMRYVIGGYMKGTAVSDDSRPDPRGDWTQVSRGLIRFDYFTAEGPVLGRVRATLDAALLPFVRWGEQNSVPLYLGEFGLMHQCFEDGRGGAQYVGDMLDLLAGHGVSFTYHTFHEPNFGVFVSDVSVPPSDADANTALIDTFRAKLGD